MMNQKALQLVLANVRGCISEEIEDIPNWDLTNCTEEEVEQVFDLIFDKLQDIEDAQGHC